MFEYKIKGITLNLSEMVSIYNHYIASCTAEYLLENGYANNEKEALEKGFKVREIMDKYHVTEDEALLEFIEKEKQVK